MGSNHGSTMTYQEDTELIREAAIELKALADQANTDEARTPYSDKEFQPVAKENWGELVYGYLGGEMGAYCRVMTPALGVALAEFLTDITAGHQPELIDGNPWVCQTCGVADGGYPCDTFSGALDLAKIILGGS